MDALSSVKPIRAQSLVLEPQLAAHACEMFGVLSDPAIYEFENEPPPSQEWLKARFERLEARWSPDGTEQWLNWVIRLPSGSLAGYVQATVLHGGAAHIAYELSSSYWRRGIASAAVMAVLQELRLNHGVHRAVAVIKARNYRSLGLVRKLGFELAGPEESIRFGAQEDEVVMSFSPLLAPVAEQADLARIDALVQRFFAQFDNREGRTPSYDALATLFVPGAIIVHDGGAQCEALTLDAFVRPRLQLLASGDLVDFHEWETSASTEITGRIATRRSTYAKCGRLRGQPYEGRGHKRFQLGWFGGEWRITAIAWTDEA